MTATWDANGGQAEVEVDMSGAKLWDEFAPNLSELTVKLGDDERTVRFGMREFAAQGTQFTLNGRPVFLRGTLECSVLPLTGYPPTDVPAWQRIYRIMKSYGLNYIRFHSWCPPEAAFAAADLEGIMIQAEGPQANVPAGSDPARDAFIEAEFKRMVDTYGNHPSFCTDDARQRVRRQGRAADALGGHADPARPAASLLVGVLRRRRPPTASGPSWPTAAASTARARSATCATSWPATRGPIIGHEIGQWMFFPDFNEMKKYTGVMAVKNFEMVRDDLEKKHLLDLAPQFVQASGKLRRAALQGGDRSAAAHAGLRRLFAARPARLPDARHGAGRAARSVLGLEGLHHARRRSAGSAGRPCRCCGCPSAPTPWTSRSRRRRTWRTTAPPTSRDAQPVWTIKDEQGREVASGKLPAVERADRQTDAARRDQRVAGQGRRARPS